MGGAAMIDPQGGQRTRGARERLGEQGIAYAGAFLLVSFIPETLPLSETQKIAMAMLLQAGFREAAKQAVLRGWLIGEPRQPNPGDRESGPGSGVAKVGMLFALCLALAGCAVGVGHQKPHFYTGGDDETVMVCEQTGVFFAFGDSSNCGAQQGGTASTAARDMVLGTIRLASQAVAGFFSGLGGMGAGLNAAVSPLTPEELRPAAPTTNADTSLRTEGATPEAAPATSGTPFDGLFR